MSDDHSIRLSNVGKMYRIFPTRTDNFLDALDLTRLVFWRRVHHAEFWALRGINLDLKKGSRLGIIGRNGAGKTTLLKLITGNLATSEGSVEVNGTVQALMDSGAGFHPEFTGYENIRASLIYQGISPAEIDVAIKDIAEFTELGEFLAQPFKTYSAGMQARLAFATATTLKPDILIIDEVLGAGDAYFAGKSSERMKHLVEESGASVLLVSHALDQVTRYCDECIWLERGRIVRRGPSMEVVTAYDAFIRTLEERRLKAKNRKRLSGQYDSAEVSMHSDVLTLAFRLQGELAARCEVSEIKLLKNKQDEETLKVGDVQDTSWFHMAMVALDGSTWSESQRVDGGYCRSLTIEPRGLQSSLGYVVFSAYALFDNGDYEFQVRYRCSNPAQLSLSISRNGSLLQNPVELPTGKNGWVEWNVPVTKLQLENTLLPGAPAQDKAIFPEQSLATKGEARPPEGSLAAQSSRRAINRWPGEGSLLIDQVCLLDAERRECTLFRVGTPMTVSVKFTARSSGKFRVIPIAVIFRLDGIVVSQHVGEPTELELHGGEQREARHEFGLLNLGNGNYVLSVALYRTLDFAGIEKPETYDLLDRCFEFQVFGNPPLLTAIFHHPGEWVLV